MGLLALQQYMQGDTLGMQGTAYGNRQTELLSAPLARPIIFTFLHGTRTSQQSWLSAMPFNDHPAYYP